MKYEITGSGEPLVLLHGTGGTRRVWDPVLPLLEPTRQVVAVDLPGFGESDPLPAGVPVTNAAVAECVVSLLDDLGISEPHVAGTSLGGHVALELGARGAARSVVAFSPTGFWTAAEASRVRRLVSFLRASAMLNKPVVPLLARSAAGRKLLLGTSYHRPANLTPAAALEAVEALVRSGRGVRAVAQAANRERIGGALATTVEAAEALDPDMAVALDGVPVTIAWAEHDKFLHPKQAARARKALPNAKHETLTGCGHLATWDNPELLAEILLAVRAC